MSVNAPAFFTSQFATNVTLLLQQKGSKLRGTVMEGHHVGESAQVVDQIGSIEMQPVTGRFQPIGRVDAPLDSRWVFPDDFDLPQLMDSFDKLKMLVDPTSSLVQNAVYAAGRKIDQEIINAVSGTSKTGRGGAVLTDLPSSQKVAANEGASSNVGMTVAKLIKATELLKGNDMDLDDPMNELTLVLTAKDESSLLREAQVISSDYNDKPVLIDGKLRRFMGVNFVHSELVPVVGGQRLNPLYAKSGVYLGMWNDIQTDISQRKDIKSLPWQAYVYMSVGATRLDEKKVVQIACV